MIEPYQLPMLKTPVMNDMHYEAVLLINQLSSAIQNADTDEIEKTLQSLIDHTREHYGKEENLMLEKGFPPYAAHKEEHDGSLVEMEKEASHFLQTKDANALGRYVENSLIPFFLRHTETMDAVTSIFLENSEDHLPYWERLVPRKQEAGVKDDG